MKFEITLKDFWLHDDENPEKSIENYLIKKVTDEIWRQTNKVTKKKIEEEIKRRIDDEIELKIKTYIDILFDNGELKIKGRYSSDQPMTMHEYIKKAMLENDHYNSPKQRIEEAAKKHADEIKKRYDLLFASQLVAKLGNAGLLKEDLEKLLLPITKENTKDEKSKIF